MAREQKLWVVFGAKVAELKSAFAGINHNFKSTRTEAMQFQRGIQYAFVGIIPSAQEFNKVLDASVSGADKLTGSLNSLSGMTNMIAMSVAKSTKEFIAMTAGLSAGFGLITYGISELQKYNKVNEASANLNKIMENQNWALSASNQKVAESWIAQVQALGDVNEANKKAIEYIKAQIALAKQPELEHGLASSFGLLTDQQGAQYKQQQALLKYIEGQGLPVNTASWRKAVGDLIQIQWASAKEWETQNQAIIQAWEAEQKRLSQQEDMANYIKAYNWNIEQQVGMEEDLAKLGWERVAAQKEYLALWSKPKSEGGGGGWSDLSKSMGQYSESELAAWQSAFGNNWQRAITAYGIAGQNKMSPFDIANTEERANQWGITINVAGENVGHAVLPAMGEAFNQRTQLGG